MIVNAYHVQQTFYWKYLTDSKIEGEREKRHENYTPIIRMKLNGFHIENDYFSLFFSPFHMHRQAFAFFRESL